MNVIMEMLLWKPSNYNSSITHTVNVGVPIQYAIVTAVWALQFGRHALLHTDILCHWTLPSSSFSPHAIVCIVMRDRDKLCPRTHGKVRRFKKILCSSFPQQPDVWMTVLINPLNSHCDVMCGENTTHKGQSRCFWTFWWCEDHNAKVMT